MVAIVIFGYHDTPTLPIIFHTYLNNRATHFFRMRKKMREIVREGMREGMGEVSLMVIDQWEDLQMVHFNC